MKWVKQNLFLVICGAVVLVALAAWYFLALPFRHKTLEQANEIFSQVDTANNLMAEHPVIIPDHPLDGPVTQWMVDQKQAVQQKIKAQAEQITLLAAKDNRVNRINDAGQPLLAGRPVVGLLPVMTPRIGDPMEFKSQYSIIFDRWAAQLVFGRDQMPPVPEMVGNDMHVPSPTSATGTFLIVQGLPPSQGEVTAALSMRAQEMARQAGAQRSATGVAIGVSGTTPGMSNVAQYEFTRAYVSARISPYKMFCTRDRFQIRPLASSPRAPSEQEIFEALVDTWIQQDLVNVIKELNGPSKNVVDSPVKNLIRIVVGASSTPVSAGPAGSDFATAASMGMGAFGGGGMAMAGGTSAGAANTTSVFLNMNTNTNTATGAPISTAMTPGAVAPGMPDYSRSMTGRVGSDRFDVAQFTIVLHIDPSKVNEFLSRLYRQNNGYTCLSVRLDSIDPMEAAGNGYIYGTMPVVRAEIVGEAMFFREWTKLLVPPSMRTALIPPMEPVSATPAAPAAAPSAAPAGNNPGSPTGTPAGFQ